VRVNAHERAAANRCAWCRATTERWRLSAAEVDKGGAPRGGDAILRTEEHGQERLAQRWFGREARSRPVRRKIGETQQRGGGVQRRRGITRASAWTCVRARVRVCASSETWRQAKAQRHTAPERKEKDSGSKQGGARVEEGNGTCKAPAQLDDSQATAGLRGGAVRATGTRQHASAQGSFIHGSKAGSTT
jgi:hypothetical protein